jgi:hypothetical protein
VERNELEKAKEWPTGISFYIDIAALSENAV